MLSDTLHLLLIFLVIQTLWNTVAETKLYPPIYPSKITLHLQRKYWGFVWCKFFQNEQKESRRRHTLKHFERQAWDHLPISAGLSFQLLLSRAHLMVTWKKYFSCVLFAGSFLSFASVFWVSSPCTSGMPQVRVGLQKRTAGWWWWWRGGGGVLDLPSHTEPGGCRLLRRWRAQALCVHVFFLPRPKMPLGKIALSSLWPSSSQLPVVVSAVHRSSLLFHV